MNSLHKIVVCVFFCFSITLVHAQSYHLYNGSSYAGVFSTYTNPASLVNAPYKWDLNVLSAQTTIINHAFDISGLFRPTDTLRYGFTNGSMPRAVYNSFDFALLNLRYRVNENTAIAFGWRGRMYSDAKTTPINYADSVSNANSFFHINKDNAPLSGFATNNGWLEFDFSLSKILKKDAHQIISAGVSLGYMKNLSGFFGQANQLSYQENALPNNEYYQTFTGLSMSSYYSHNYDLYDSTKDFFSNAKAFIKDTKSSINFSLGFEILLKKYQPYDEVEVSSTNYDWKIGASIMDIGKNSYAPNDRAYTNGALKTNLTSYDLQNKFNNIQNLKQFTDSLITCFSRYDSLKNNFSISMPTRMIVSVDRNLGDHFFINVLGDISFYATTPYRKVTTRELNILTLTPRWEKKNVGVYMPISYNVENNLWIGAGFKLGPLLFGIHNLGWLFGKADQLRGGLYFGIHIKPGEKDPKSRYDCY